MGESLLIFFMIMAISKMRYTINTGDNSIQGYYEYLKDKYWTKKQ